MPLHSLAPGYAKIHYTIESGSVLEHVMTLPLKITLLDGDTTEVGRKGDIDILWDDAVAEYVTPLADLFAITGTEFVRADLFSQADADSPPIYEATTDLSGFAGTSNGAIAVAQQDVYTFKSQNGGGIRVTLLEDTQGVNNHRAYGALGVVPKAFVDYLLGATSCYYARDNGFPQVFLFQTTKENDKLRRIRFNL